MTVQKKAGMASGLTLASIVAVLALWPQVVPVLNWLAPIVAREQVQAVGAAVALAFFAGVLLPYILPPQWPPTRTRTVTGLVCATLAGGGAYYLVPTQVGAFYAFLSFLAAPTLTQALMGVWYWAIPSSKPESLQP
jgi:hypothetical protein